MSHPGRFVAGMRHAGLSLPESNTANLVLGSPRGFIDSVHHHHQQLLEIENLRKSTDDDQDSHSPSTFNSPTGECK